MKVKELIEKLSEIENQDAEILIESVPEGSHLVQYWSEPKIEYDLLLYGNYRLHEGKWVDKPSTLPVVMLVPEHNA